MPMPLPAAFINELSALLGDGWRTDAATREAVSAMLLQEQAQGLLIVVSHQPPVQADFQILRLQEKA